jgi:tocopherol O-methyltransferase
VGNQPSIQEIQGFYDVVSPLYRDLWAGHIHHGYYPSGRETKEEATEGLIRFLAEASSLKPGAKVLDIGCGIGGTSIWLSQNFGCEVTGITISPAQRKMAEEAASGLVRKPEFLLMDANRMTLTESFDAIWAVEVLSHLGDHLHFFRKCHFLLNPGGRICIAAWLKAENLTAREEREVIRPIEEGMFCALSTSERYLKLLDESRFKLVRFEDISPRVKQTWDIGLKIIRDKAVWAFAARHGMEFLRHLRGFRRMKRGFEEKKFVYGIFVAEKIRPPLDPFSSD